MHLLAVLYVSFLYLLCCVSRCVISRFASRNLVCWCGGFYGECRSGQVLSLVCLESEGVQSLGTARLRI